MQSPALAFGLAVGERLLAKHSRALRTDCHYGDPIIDKSVELLKKDGFKVVSSSTTGSAMAVRLASSDNAAEILYNRAPNNENEAPKILWKSGEEQRAACFIDDKLKLGVQKSLSRKRSGPKAQLS